MLKEFLDSAARSIEHATSTKALEDLRVAILGKSGELTAELKTLGALPPDERKARGAEVNQAKEAITQAIEAKKSALETAELDARLANETLDITLPAVPAPRGSIHPITQVTEELTAIFAEFGFTVAEGPEIEDDFHNFTALNIPESHPARQMHDTFYLRGTSGAAGSVVPSPLRGGIGRGASDRSRTNPHPPTEIPLSTASTIGKTEQGDFDSPAGGELSEPASSPLLLRTHTSPVQIRTMMAQKPPIRIVASGTTYRSDSDMTHTPMFHQIEGLVIEKSVNMGHLKGLLNDALAAFFGLEKLPMRFRASFFPFTEPSAEVDIGCSRGRDALVIGEGADWLEIAGCGMVHPNVLKNCGIDPNEWQGFAFGFGIERLAMLKYNIPDLRTFFAGDLRWLEHYGLSPLGACA